VLGLLSQQTSGRNINLVVLALAIIRLALGVAFCRSWPAMRHDTLVERAYADMSPNSFHPISHNQQI